MADVRIASPASSVGIIVPYRTYIYVAFKTIQKESFTVENIPITLMVPKIRTTLSDRDKKAVYRYLLHLPTSISPVIKEFKEVPVEISLSFFTPSLESGIDRIREFFTEILHILVPYYRDPALISILTDELNKRKFLYAFNKLSGSGNTIQLPILDPDEIYIPSFQINLYHSGEYSSFRRTRPYGVLVVRSSAE